MFIVLRWSLVVEDTSRDGKSVNIFKAQYDLWKQLSRNFTHQEWPWTYTKEAKITVIGNTPVTNKNMASKKAATRTTDIWNVQHTLLR